MLREIGPAISTIRRVTDMLITFGSFIMAYFIKLKSLPGDLGGLSTVPNYYLVLMLVIIIWYLCFRAFGVYRSQRQKLLSQILWQYTRAVGCGMMMLMITMYLLNLPHVSRLMLGLFFVLNLGLLFAEKTFVYAVLRRYRSRGFNTRNLLILGSKSGAREVIDALWNERWSGLKIIGCLDQDKRKVGKKVLDDVRVIGAYTDLEEILKDRVVDELVLADDLKEIPNVQAYLAMADEMGIQVHILPQWKIRELGIDPKIGRLKCEVFLGIPALSIDSTPEFHVEMVFKAIIDYAVAVSGTIVTLPVWMVAAIMIKALSPGGPVLYRQERLGQNGRRFDLYKFRTMVPDADRMLDELKDANECDGPVFKIKDDPRIIPYIGKFLRKTGLDELPQFINVLKGELSVVGPRPPLPSEVACYERWERRRLSIKPGITCYWQIQPNRNDISFKEWMKLDLAYIDNWSPWVDTKIFFRTVLVMLTGSGR